MRSAPTLKAATDAYRQRYGALVAFLLELVAVRAGLKTATQITLGAPAVVARERPRMERFCRAAGLCCTFYTRRGVPKVIIAQAALPPPADDEDENRDNRFSYPACGVESFRSHPTEYYFIERLRGLLEPGGRYDFRVNPFTGATPFHLVRPESGRRTRLAISPPCSRWKRYVGNRFRTQQLGLRLRPPGLRNQACSWWRRSRAAAA